MRALRPQGKSQARVLSAKDTLRARATRAASSSRLNVKLQGGWRGSVAGLPDHELLRVAGSELSALSILGVQGGVLGAELSPHTAPCWVEDPGGQSFVSTLGDDYDAGDRRNWHCWVL